MHFLYLTCSLTYAATFVHMDPKLRAIIGAFAVFLDCGIIYVCWMVTSCVMSLYDDFSSIVKMYPANIGVEMKFKIIGFMKRFKGEPIGISFAECFYVKRNFPMRVSMKYLNYHLTH
ncbi:uncharacterized protein LOC111615602 [Centruroides sculpturatus]|uniref:uncharacterized protein LOC111615602 n=1 Tax=Centruroides sculpturatus TaxID=218467 RepID=UPI000C6D7063|nr:uncharacterized protein LOC111615602 [Centruroides sculpturatus]